MEVRPARILRTTSSKSLRQIVNYWTLWALLLLISYNSYGYPSPGGMNWGGNSPCIFSVDSPNFGGLICSSTVISADLWKLGQLKPHDKFSMVPVSLEDALQHGRQVGQYLAAIADVIQGKKVNVVVPSWDLPRADIEPNRAILKTVASSGNALRPKVTYRQV